MSPALENVKVSVTGEDEVTGEEELTTKLGRLPTVAVREAPFPPGVFVLWILAPEAVKRVTVKEAVGLTLVGLPTAETPIDTSDP